MYYFIKLKEKKKVKEKGNTFLGHVSSLFWASAQIALFWALVQNVNKGTTP